MPPQPLSSVRPTATVNLGTIDIKRRPLAAQWVASCINIWSNVELNLGFMMTAMLGETAIPTVAIYVDLIALRTRLTALKAAADWTLNLEQHDIFLALHRIVGKAARTRDRMAHHLWTYSDDLPDDLLLIDPREILPLYTVAIGKFIRSSEPSRIEVDKTKVYVYRPNDLKEIQDWFLQINNYIAYFNEMVLTHDVARQFQLYELLSQEPLIAPHVNRLRADRNKTAEPEPPPQQ